MDEINMDATGNDALEALFEYLVQKRLEKYGIDSNQSEVIAGMYGEEMKDLYGIETDNNATFNPEEITRPISTEADALFDMIFEDNDGGPVPDEIQELGREEMKKDLTELLNFFGDGLNDFFNEVADAPANFFDWLTQDKIQDSDPFNLRHMLLIDLDGNIIPNMNNSFNNAQNFFFPRVDPLVLDLDGDGIETLGINADTHVVFDHDNNGVKTGTGWISADDGLLVLDRNGNGTIDSGRELFGNQTLVNGQTAEDGYAALSAEDTNADGVFDANDANFKNVRVWQDANSDGISQEGELHTLAELGIASIGINSTDTNINTNGNVQSAEGTYTKTDGTTGTTGTTGNLDLAENTFYREFTEKIELSETAKSLAEMSGSGLVRDLREASMLSSSLTSTVQSMQEGYESHDALMTQKLRGQKS